MPNATYEHAHVQDHTPTLKDLRDSRRATLTVSEVAALLGLDQRTVRRACQEGQLPAVRVGRRILIPLEHLLPLLTPSSGCNGLAVGAPVVALSDVMEDRR